MKRITFLIVGIAVFTTIAVGCKAASSPLSLAAIAFIAWAVSPYIYLALANRFMATKRAAIALLIFALVTGVFGVVVIIDAMFIHLDAQGGLVFLFVPVWQWIFLVIATVPLHFLNRTKTA